MASPVLNYYISYTGFVPPVYFEIPGVSKGISQKNPEP